MRRLVATCLLTLLLLSTTALAALAATLPLTDDPTLRIPQDERIYYILVDRFYHGDATAPADPQGRHGGNLQGVINKLDYIKELGFTAINLSPIFAGASDYTGFDATDLRTVDPHVGDLALAKKLVEQAHMRQMKVFLDLPVRPEGEGALTGDSLFWIDETNVDGFRLFGADALSPDFWRGYAAALKERSAHMWLLAELTAPETADPAAYQAAGLAVLDQQGQQATAAVYGRQEPTEVLRTATVAGLAAWPAPSNIGGYLDGPHQPRIATVAQGETARVMLAMIHLYTHTAVPILYYGTEIGLTGESGAAANADFPWESYMYRNPDLYMLTKALNQIRDEHLALRRGDWTGLLTEPYHYAFARQIGRDRVVVAFNTSATEQFTAGVPVAGKVEMPDGTRLFDKLSGKRMRVKNGIIPLELAPGTAAIITVEETTAGIYFTVAIGAASLLIAGTIILGQRRRAG